MRAILTPSVNGSNAQCQLRRCATAAGRLGLAEHTPVARGLPMGAPPPAPHPPMRRRGLWRAGQPLPRRRGQRRGSVPLRRQERWAARWTRCRQRARPNSRGRWGSARRQRRSGPDWQGPTRSQPTAPSGRCMSADCSARRQSGSGPAAWRARRRAALPITWHCCS